MCNQKVWKNFENYMYNISLWEYENENEFEKKYFDGCETEAYWNAKKFSLQRFKNKLACIPHIQEKNAKGL